MFLDKEIKSVMACDLEGKRKSFDVKPKKFRNGQNLEKLEKTGNLEMDKKNGLLTKLII